MTTTDDSPLWAITTYFNPLGYKSRRQNYDTFRDRIAVPIVTVEWSLSETFELGGDAADIVIQLSAPDILWQKERLLNVALQHLPDSCRYVAWVDCDVVLDAPDWPERACRLLEQYSLIHLFGEAFDVPRNADLSRFMSNPERPGAVSLGAGIARDSVCWDEQLFQRGRVDGRYSAGLAWAMPRKLIEQHQFYDACVIGGGDTSIICAAQDKFWLARQRHQMTHEYFSHYLDWARSFQQSVAGQVGFLDNRIFHLWHGDLKNRRNPAMRIEGFSQFDYDPRRDIAVDESGCWRWSSDKPEMHRFVVDYFEARREDG